MSKSTSTPNYWLMKSEPAVYSITDLQRDGTTLWDGVRNYQARNYLRQMQPGDLVFFYHSNSNPPGIAGLMRVITPDVVDPTQFDAQSKYYDAKSTPEQPRWQTVQVEFVQVFPEIIPLEQLRQKFSAEELVVVRQGNRLSVLPVPESVAEKILALSD
ncbi:EVE domain-containing protein [Leptolyngbya sp. 'hensonii']|uniref:EVE domain-containing protein n=1 Tax=Leptolyngbya sp. 'hensonii' TaxID=1922337 RepID=UPI000950160B|nr:EVE domain-containing protein [Leptolyngbya sp. 'hensonii']OLP17238.1 EVE domain-containing protein [Leptolyngbya sp. 'hensonii']